MKTEQDVKIKWLLPYLEERGYSTEHMDFEVAIEVQEGRKLKHIFADVVVYATAEKTAPILLCEPKSANTPLTKDPS